MSSHIIFSTFYGFMEINLETFMDIFRDILAKRYVYHYFSEAFRSNSGDRLDF